MSEPVIAERKPVIPVLEAGHYLWCVRRVALCNCKRSGFPPMCDGRHKLL